MSNEDKDLKPNVEEVNTEGVQEEKKEARIQTDPDMLPKDTVHCYPASQKSIFLRRIACAALLLFSLFWGAYFLLPATFSIIFAIFSFVVALIAVLVIAQTFLIASYRVAVDYNNKQFILRYQFQKIKIDFANFETRDGKPDQAEELRSKAFNKNAGTQYLILDDIRSSACYQTSSRDLTGLADFLLLKKDAIDVQSAYRGLIVDAKEKDSEKEMDEIIKNSKT